LICLSVVLVCLGLAVGEIPTLTHIARLQRSIIEYELLNSCEIFRLQYWCRPSRLYFKKEITCPIHPKGCARRLEWFAKRFNLRPTYLVEEDDAKN
jgi:hypothetical protein